MNRRRLLLLLTLLWLPAGLVAWLLLSGRWLAEPADATIRSLLLAFVVLETAVVLAGWAIVLWRELAARRQVEAPPPPAAQPVTLAQLQSMAPSEFEAWVQKLFRNRGYFVTNTPDTADHGIDLEVATPDGEHGIVQCKRYEGTVGEPVVRDLFGVMEHENVQRGFLVTTGRISQEAELWAQDKPIELIDGEQLVKLANERPGALS